MRVGLEAGIAFIHGHSSAFGVVDGEVKAILSTSPPRFAQHQTTSQDRYRTVFATVDYRQLYRTVSQPGRSRQSGR